MKQKVTWALVFLLLCPTISVFAESMESTEAFEEVEQVEEVSSSSIVEEQVESSSVIELEESSMADELETSEGTVENNSDETSADTERPIEKGENVFRPLTLYTAIDDNTLIIRGISEPNVTIELNDEQGHTFLTTMSNSVGEFKFRLSAPFSARQPLIFEYREASDGLNETSVIVGESGLKFEAVVDEQIEISGLTSPSRAVRLTTEDGVVLDEQRTDSEGNFLLTTSIGTDEKRSFIIQVMDDHLVARQESTEAMINQRDDVEASEDGVLQPTTITPFALIDLDLLNIQNSVRLDNLPISDTDDTITGRIVIDENSFDDGILGILGNYLQQILAEILTLLSGKNITLTITNGANVTQLVEPLSSLNGWEYSFDISNQEIIPGETVLSFSVDSVVLDLSLLLIDIISAEVIFEDLILGVEGNQLSLLNVPEAISFTQTPLDVAEPLNIYRSTTDPLSIKVLDTKSLSNPDEPEWRVMVHAPEPLTLYEGGEVRGALNGALYFNQQLIEGSTNAQVVGYQSDFIQGNGGLNSLAIRSDQDFYLNFTPAYDAIEGNYTTTLLWELVDGY